VQRRLSWKSVRAQEISLEDLVKPMAWHYTTGTAAHSANKSLKGPGGHVRRLGFAETVGVGRGAGRFGMPVEKLTPWPAIAQAAHIAPKMARALEQAAVLMGANARVVRDARLGGHRGLRV
jgi:hypothetical protein